MKPEPSFIDEIRRVAEAAVQAAVQARHRGGAARIVLCASTEVDGLTPAESFIADAPVYGASRRGVAP